MRAPLGRSRQLMAHPRALLQGLPGVPMGAAGGRGRASSAAHEWIRRGRRRRHFDRRFREAVALGPRVDGHHDEEAQYSLPFPVAAALVYGDIGPEEVSPAKLADPPSTELQQRTTLRDDADFSAAFRRSAGRACASCSPMATVRVRAGARARQSGKPARRRRAAPQYFAYGEPVLGGARAARIEQAVDGS